MRRRPQLEVLEDRCLLSFGSVVAYPAGIAPQAVVAGDFNSDGAPDLALATQGPIHILLGNGDGTLRDGGDFSQYAYGKSMVTGDLNRDGRLDLVFVNGGSSVSVLLGNGDGSFQPGPDVTIDGGATNSVAVGDFNADGTLDLVLAGSHNFSGADEYGGSWSASFGELSVLLGQGDGTFSVAASMLMDYFPGDMTLADLNGDAKLDVAFTGASRDRYESVGALQIILGTGDGGFQFGSTYNYNSPTSVAAADFNGDGKTDLVVGNYTLYSTEAATLNLFVGKGDGTFHTPYTIASGGNGGGGATVEVGDFNRDGQTDIAVTKRYGDRVNVLLGLGNGTFRAPESFAVGSSPIALVVVDLDGNGFTDLATANIGSSAASVLLNDGAWSTLPPPPPPPSISIGDVTQKEGNGKKTTLFTFTLSSAYDQAVTISSRTGDATAATSNGDYVAKTGTLTFAPGETTKTITIEVKSDSKKEANETFFVDLFGISGNLLLTKSRGIGTILNDD